jgi:hypothetical protein
MPAFKGNTKPSNEACDAGLRDRLFGCDKPFFDTSGGRFRKVLDINLTGTFIVARRLQGRRHYADPG